MFWLGLVIGIFIGINIGILIIALTLIAKKGDKQLKSAVFERKEQEIISNSPGNMLNISTHPTPPMLNRIKKGSKFS